MRFGYWTPIFGGWLRNVDDEQTPVSFAHIAEIARAAEEGDFDLTLIPELNLNDIKGVEAPSLDAWAVTAGLAAVTSKLELLAAVRPGFHNPFHTAKQAATIDEISGGRFTLNVVSAWWAEEAKQYDGLFSAHDDRYARTIEWVEVLRGLWSETPFAYEGEYYRTEGTYLEPKPRVQPRLYAGGESEAGRNAITRFADAYLTHGGTLDELSVKVADMRRRREEAGATPFEAFGMAAYAVVRDTEEEAQAEIDGSPTCVGERPTGRTRTSSASRSSTPRSTSRSTRCRTAAFAPTSSEPPIRWRNASSRSRTWAFRPCCCSSRRTCPSCSASPPR